MSTIYRYLDVLSVEKCIDNINDFIKTKQVFIIMSVMLFFFTFLCIVKTKNKTLYTRVYTRKENFEYE